MNIENERKLFLEYMRSIGYADFMFELDESGDFDDMSMCYAWLAWQASANREGFVLVANNRKTIVAIEQMIEQQVEASGMDSKGLERLDGWRIMDVIVEASQESKDE